MANIINRATPLFMGGGKRIIPSFLTNSDGAIYSNFNLQLHANISENPYTLVDTATDCAVTANLIASLWGEEKTEYFLDDDTVNSLGVTSSGTTVSGWTVTFPAQTTTVIIGVNTHPFDNLRNQDVLSMSFNSAIYFASTADNAEWTQVLSLSGHSEDEYTEKEIYVRFNFTEEADEYIAAAKIYTPLLIGTVNGIKMCVYLNYYLKTSDEINAHEPDVTINI